MPFFHICHNLFQGLIFINVQGFYLFPVFLPTAPTLFDPLALLSKAMQTLKTSYENLFVLTA